jgi:hypothetical protein
MHPLGRDHYYIVLGLLLFTFTEAVKLERHIHARLVPALDTMIEPNGLVVFNLD